MQEIKNELITQDNRWTSWPIYIVVEDKKIYGADSDFMDGKERKDTDAIDWDGDICAVCMEEYNKTGELPEECDLDECENSFISYRIAKDVPNLYGAFFLTAKACEEHLAASRHHYNSTAHTYAISACHNAELQKIINHIMTL